MIDGKPNYLAERDYTFLTQIEEQGSQTLKVIYEGTEEKITESRQKILNNIIKLLNTKIIKLKQLRLEYNFLYNVQVDIRELYKAFGYGILKKDIIPVSLVRFPNISNRYFVNKRIYQNMRINKSLAKKEEIEKKLKKQQKKKTEKKQPIKKIITKKIHIKPKTLMEILSETEGEK